MAKIADGSILSSWGVGIQIFILFIYFALEQKTNPKFVQ